MLNIISRSILSGEVGGPKKVANNLIKGLDILGYPYCINKALDATSQLWIHDDLVALQEASKLKLAAVVGPNLYVLPRNVPKDLDMSSFVYIHPSTWVTDLWRDFGFNKCPLESWPVGIDTKQFDERRKPENGMVLIYFKERYQEELDFIKNILEESKVKYEVITYGSYKQDDYIKKLENTKYIIWLGKTESQGLALEEALSMDVPALVWDVSSLGHYISKIKNKVFNTEELNYTNVTSAYYFNESCGLKTKNKDSIKDSISEMEKNWKVYESRKYIVENFGLEKQAKELIELFNKYYKISYESGVHETVRSNRKWRNDTAFFKIFIFIKEKVKKCVMLLKK